MSQLIMAEQGNVVVPAAGSISLYDDGVGGLCKSTDDASGITALGEYNIFKLTADGAAIGPGITDFFGANSSIALAANGIYYLEFFIYYYKTTAGTVVYTITNTAVVTNLVASYLQSAVGGIGTNAATTQAGLVTQTTATAALPATASQTTLTNQWAYIFCQFENASSANVRLRVTSSAGTVTPRRGSFYTCRRLTAGNMGTFVA